jgi:uncharacterized membrane protein YagU involved in acid resistance
MNARGLKWGAYGGVAGGLIFGGMMGMMGMLPMIGQMVGQPSALVGFAVHMVNSVIIGIGFSLVLGRLAKDLANGLTSGLAYGAVWWVLGPLTLMPLFMGMGLGVNWNATAAVAMLPSLVGHLIYGGILGFIYAWLAQHDRPPELATAH